MSASTGSYLFIVRRFPDGAADRTAEEDERFSWQLKNCNLLYLGSTVISLIDLAYQSRFWTTYELWLGIQVVDTKTGFVSPRSLANMERPRLITYCVHSATPEIVDAVVNKWMKLRMDEAYDTLSKPDVVVTNQSDKTNSLSRLKELRENILQTMKDVQASEEGHHMLDIHACPPGYQRV